MGSYEKKPIKTKTLFRHKNKNKLIQKNYHKRKKNFVKYFDNKIKSINTFNLLSFIKKKNKKAKLFFLIGADNLEKFHKWNNWKKIPKLAKIIVFPRHNYSKKLLNSTVSKKLDKQDFIYMNSKKINISSSLIRKFW